MREKTSNKVPQIRLKRFDREWEKKTLGSVLRLENGFAFKSKYFSDDTTGVVVLTPGSVKVGGGFQNGTGHFYKLDGDNPTNYKFEPGDLFITMTDLTPTAQALGYPAKVPDDGITYLHNQRLGKLVDFGGDKDFLFQLLSTENYHRIIVSTSSGTTVKHSSPQKFLRIENYFPTVTEQTQIGEYFRELDSLIGLHQRKHDKLVTLKKAMLQKMFPQAGASIPEIRFEGFWGNWAEKRLDEICEIVGGGTPSTLIQEYWEGHIDWYSPTEIGDKVYASGSVKKITLLGLSKSSARLLPPGNTVLFTSRAGIGDMAILTKEGCTNQGFQSMVLTDDADPYFIYSMGYLIKIHALKHASGSTFLEISSKQLGKMKILLPNKKEQQKIGTYFRTLDALIAQHATQLQKLQQIKSACLEKMFV